MPINGAKFGDRTKWYWTKWHGQNGSNFYRFQFNGIEFLFSNHKSQILYHKAKSLCICLFSVSAKKLTNRLTQAHKIGNECRVHFSWSREHVFNFLRFVIQKLRVF